MARQWALNLYTDLASKRTAITSAQRNDRGRCLMSKCDTLLIDPYTKERNIERAKRQAHQGNNDIRHDGGYL